MSDNPYEAPFLYTAKASRSERDAGCEHLFWKYEGSDPVQITKEEYDELEAAGERVAEGNIHPTVKPVEVMEWLVNRLCPEDGVVLDPFTGSGTTGIAAIKAGRDAQLIELNADGSYAPIIRGRLEAAKYTHIEEVPVWEAKPEITVPTDVDETPQAEDDQEVNFGDLFG